MTLEDFRITFLLTSFLGALIFASPALAFVFPLRVGETFTSLYVLGPDHMAGDYPFDTMSDKAFMVYLGLANHMGSSVYYEVQVKLRTQNEPLPNSTVGRPSPLPSLFEYRVLIAGGAVWEKSLILCFKTLSLDDESYVVGIMTLDGLDIPITKSIPQSGDRGGPFVQLFFELWIYDMESHSFSFDKRFVGIWLNVTV